MKKLLKIIVCICSFNYINGGVVIENKSPNQVMYYQFIPYKMTVGIINPNTKATLFSASSSIALYKVEGTSSTLIFNINNNTNKYFTISSTFSVTSKDIQCITTADCPKGFTGITATSCNNNNICIYPPTRCISAYDCPNLPTGTRAQRCNDQNICVYPS